MLCRAYLNILHFLKSMRISGNKKYNAQLFNAGSGNISQLRASLYLEYIEIPADMIIETDNLIDVIYEGNFTKLDTQDLFKKDISVSQNKKTLNMNLSYI